MHRREFLGVLGGAAAVWPMVARAQDRKVPVIGYLYGGSLASEAHLLAKFREELAKSGFIEGHNVAIEYRFADGHYERLPDLVADLVRQPMSCGVPNAIIQILYGTAVIRRSLKANGG